MSETDRLYKKSVQKWNRVSSFIENNKGNEWDNAICEKIAVLSDSASESIDELYGSKYPIKELRKPFNLPQQLDEQKKKQQEGKLKKDVSLIEKLKSIKTICYNYFNER